MAEKFCKKFGPGAHQLKIGKSFEKKGGNSVFHSIRYDFKPVSVDEEKMGMLEVQENRSVSVTLPHVDGHGATNYKGNAKPANTKECVLIIDHETGELTLERISNQIMLKKTRPEKPDRPNIFQDKGYSSNSSPHDRGESIDGLVMPTNPYQVKPEPDKVRRNEPKSEPENPYQVKPEPDNPYLVKPQPDMPHKDRKLPPKAKGSNSARPNSPQIQSSAKKSPGVQRTISPFHSNKSSPVRPSSTVQKGQGYVDSLGRVIPPESSDDSDSASSSGSDSDSDSESAADKGGCMLADALEAATESQPSSFGLSGDLGDLLLPDAPPSQPQPRGQVASARPQQMHQPNSQREQSRKEERSMPSFSSMPSLGDLGDDLQLSDSD